VLEILPSINRPTWQEVKSDIKKIENHADWVEVDVADGTLSKVKTWNNPEELKNLQLTKPLKFCVHLMVKNPGKYIKQWIDAKVRRVIIQFEGVGGGFLGSKTKKTIQEMANLCKENWVEFGLSISPKTDVGKMAPYLDSVDIAQILSVPIGLNNQGLDFSQLSKMAELKYLQKGNKFRTEWDGGVDMESITQIKKSGADIIVSTSFVFGAAEPAKALEALKRTAIGIGV
jgi:ribulose-phosphate 3-epimerase